MHRVFPRFLIATLALSSSGAAATREAELRAEAWIKAWDGQGLHRTGTVGDEAGASWLAREAAAIAGPVTSESFPLDRIDTTAAYVEFEGTRIEGEILFDGFRSSRRICQQRDTRRADGACFQKVSPV